jgi:carboxyl-terminal processing protease
MIFGSIRRVVSQSSTIKSSASRMMSEWTAGLAASLSYNVSGKVLRNGIAILLTSSVPSTVFALDCKQVRLLTQYYFKMHFTYTEFNDELSKRSLDLFIKAWDPGKLYFTQSDVDRFEKDYATNIDDAITAADCKFIDDIVKVYGQRFDERQKSVDESIAVKHDFTIDEYMEVDRKKLPWAKTSEELNDRWRKRVKFQIMGLRETITEEKKIQEKMIKRTALLRKRHKETSSDQVMGIFLNAFASALDPHSDYMGPDELEDFRINTRLSLEGIGAVLRSEDGFTTIQSLVPGGAAALSGQVKADDKIIAVAQNKDSPVDVIDMDLRDVVKLIRGHHGTEVKLTIIREEKGVNVQHIVSLKRQKVQLTDRAAKSAVKIVRVGSGASAKDMKIGVVTLPSFYMDFEGRQNKQKDFKSSSVDMLREIESMKKGGVEGIIVDLRNNGGGSLDEAITVSGLFIKSGPVVQIRGSDGSNFVQEDKDPSVAWDGPLAVIINRQSASASEIFAGAIQDYGRGLIVGDTHTFGKGTVQNLNDVSDKLGAVKVTISKFYRPSGSSTQLRGVESDVVIPDILEEVEIGEKFYDYALPWEKIKESDYKNLGEVVPYAKKLAEASSARLLTDKTFKQIADDIKTYKDKELERSRFSLKEKSAKERMAEKEKMEQRNGKGKSKDGEDADENSDVALIDDGQLQESLRITADYVALRANKPLVALGIPEVATAEKARLAKKLKKEPSIGTNGVKAR